MLTIASCSTVACQRLFSPPKPPISFSARVSLTVHSATCCAKLSFLAVASAYWDSKLRILASTACAMEQCTLVCYNTNVNMYFNKLITRLDIACCRAHKQTAYTILLTAVGRAQTAPWVMCLNTKNKYRLSANAWYLLGVSSPASGC